MKKKISLSIIVPAYNEEKNIQSAVTGILTAIKNTVEDYEVIIINDGSTDKTGEIAERMERKNNKIRLISHEKNKGFGYTFLDGVACSKKEYVTQFHGDNDSSFTFFKDLIDDCNKVDIVSTYSCGTSSRSIPRKVVSRIFVIFMNLLFGVHLKYFNGAFICKTKILQSLHLVSKGFAIYAETKIRLMKRGYAIKEIPFEHIGRKSGKSKATGFSNVIQTMETIGYLIRDIYIYHKS